MPNANEQETKTIEFSPINNGNEVTGNTPETLKEEMLHGENRSGGGDENEG